MFGACLQNKQIVPVQPFAAVRSVWCWFCSNQITVIWRKGVRWKKKKVIRDINLRRGRCTLITEQKKKCCLMHIYLILSLQWTNAVNAECTALFIQRRNAETTQLKINPRSSGKTEDILEFLSKTPPQSPSPSNLGPGLCVIQVMWRNLRCSVLP